MPGNNAGYAFYDSDKNYITGANTINDNTIFCPLGACFLRFSIPSGAEGVKLYALDNHNGEYDDLTIKNNNQYQLTLLPDGTYMMDSTGRVVDLAANYGHDNKVLTIPIDYSAKRTMVIRFRVKFNDDLNKRSSQINYDEENPSLLNFFTMSSGGHKLRLGVLPDMFNEIVVLRKKLYELERNLKGNNQCD